MKKILTSIAILGLISFLSACPGKEEKAEAPAEPAPAAEAAAPAAPAAEAAAPAADPSLEKKVMDAAKEVKKTL